MDDLMNRIKPPVTRTKKPDEAVCTYDTAWDDVPVPVKAKSKPKAPASDASCAAPAVADKKNIMLTEAMKGIAGAVIGSIPGVLLWILIGKTGIFAAICGVILAAGIVAGYNLMTKDNTLSSTVGIVICLAVVIVAVYFCERVIWAWELTDQLQRYISATSPELYALGESGGMDRSQIDTIINENLLKEYGFSKITFGECFSHFHRVVWMLGLNEKYSINLIIAYGCAVLGGFWLFKKASY